MSAAADFKALLLQSGCRIATTLLNRGNAVAESTARWPRALAAAIAAALRSRFGFEVPVIVKSLPEFDTIVARKRLVPAVEEHRRLLVAFAQDDRALANLKALRAVLATEEEFLLYDCAAFLYCPGGSLRSRAGAALRGRLGAGFTTRNWRTVLKLHALAHRGAA
ncbi:MAG TPA: DUF1697 domain-containing protein [Steroidobacteraceae bacterium]|nr:DUF1697 domain-containing protein [Steroidobacteraceae bacterium]